MSTRTPSLIDSVEQEREQEEFIEINDFDDCIEEKSISQRTDGQAICLCDTKI